MGYMQRFGMVIRLRKEGEQAYREYHANAWPRVLEVLRECNIRNYSIFLKDGLMFSYFEYHGTDFAADMAKMAADETTKRWWAVVQPLQEPLATRKQGEWWAEMEEIFHTD